MLENPREGTKTKVDNLMGPKQSVLTIVFNTNGKYDGGVSIFVEILKSLKPK